jgi:hypothetical protein
MDEYPDFVRNLVKSVGLQLPSDNGELQITCDDVEHMQVWFGIKHKAGKDGRVFANVHFHRRSLCNRATSGLGLSNIS